MTKFIVANDPNSQENKEKYEKAQKWVFLSTFVNYAMAHWTRKYIIHYIFNHLFICYLKGLTLTSKSL